MAAGDFAAAVDFLHPPIDGSGAETWTVDSLSLRIQNYGSWDRLADGARMRVTPIADAIRLGPPRHAVYRHEHKPPSIDFTLPLDSEWSDLTAVIDMIEVHGRWAFVLYDLRVL